MSISPEPIFASMKREFMEVGGQSFIFAVGLATLTLIKTTFLGPFLKFLIDWGLLFVAIFKTCSMYTPPKKEENGYNVTIHDYPLAQILVDIFLWSTTTGTLGWISQIETNLTEGERMAHGKLVHIGVLFCTSLNWLIMFRGGFLFLDWIGGGQLGRGMRNLVCKEVEGLPVGKANVHED